MIGLYARVSTQEQKEHGHSVGEQIDRMQKYCDAMKWTIYKVYNDAGFSGATTNRPALQRMISDIKAGKIDRVLVYKLDRLSRSQKDTLTLIDDVFLGNNCDFVSMSENFDTSSPFGRAMIGILAVFAQLEREQIKERIIMGKHARAKKGLFGGSPRVPIGYDYIDGKLVTNEFEKMQIIKIFNDYANGKGILKILKELNDAGYCHKYGEWLDRTLRNVLRKKTYSGYIFYKDSWYKGDHEAFISEELYEKVQQIREKRKDDFLSKNMRAGKATTYLGGFLYCARCGSKYAKFTSRQRKEKYTYEYYTCYARTRKGSPFAKADSCDNKYWRVDELDRIIFGEIKKLALDPNYITDIQSENQDDRPRVITAKINDLDTQLERLMDLYTVGNMPIEILQEKIYALNDQKIKLEDDLEKIETEIQEKLTRDEALDLVQSFGDVLDRGDFDEIRAVIGTLIDRIEIDGDDITIKWAFS